MKYKPGYGVATKVSQMLTLLTFREKGENITLNASCNAEGKFLPTYLMLKENSKKNKFADEMPPASQVPMNEISVYVTTVVFTDWFKIVSS
jgi:hypothetical protein